MMMMMQQQQHQQQPAVEVKSLSQIVEAKWQPITNGYRFSERDKVYSLHKEDDKRRYIHSLYRLLMHMNTPTPIQYPLEMVSIRYLERLLEEALLQNDSKKQELFMSWRRMWPRRMRDEWMKVGAVLETDASASATNVVAKTLIPNQSLHAFQVYVPLDKRTWATRKTSVSDGVPLSEEMQKALLPYVQKLRPKTTALPQTMSIEEWMLLLVNIEHSLSMRLADLSLLKGVLETSVVKGMPPITSYVQFCINSASATTKAK